ncbi:serine/threonine protein kinase [Chloracidobacterium sp. MS 40/45]|uniref:serine/threonine-protein kinase n=1 Tax=Chloracidobacterium aggregatum TaxID=2851959 RepID=UPI001B8D34BE|nr:serine/threonine-protein kinase [Chloracidobacterium aggregatum]QUW01565.1 serine/threonine protein kinase [Chloracidobacterium sp. MS 40/45]
MKLCPVCHTCYEDSARFCVRDGAQLLTGLPGPTLLPGDRFRFLRLLATGRMGDAYLATDAVANHHVLIKALPGHLFANAESCRQFTANLTRLTTLQAPNLVTYQAVIEMGQGYVALVTEYVVGHDLREELAEHRPLSPRRAATVTAGVAQGVAATHAVGIPHLDLKPENILLFADAETQALRVKVADVGLACLKEGLAGSVTDDTGSEIARLPYYTSPEACHGEALDWRTDIYSLGVIMYEMLAGRPPFYAKSPGQVLSMQTGAPPKPLSLVNPALPEALVQLTMRMLAKQPAERPQTMQEVGDVCWRWLQSQEGPESFIPPSPPGGTAAAAPAAPVSSGAAPGAAPDMSPPLTASYDLPLRLTIIDADDEGNRSRTIPGRVQEASPQGMRILTGTVETGQLNIIRDHTVAFKNRLAIEVDLPEGTVRMHGFAVRYQRAPDGRNWVVYIYIKEMPRDDRRRYEAFLRERSA